MGFTAGQRTPESDGGDRFYATEAASDVLSQFKATPIHHCRHSGVGERTTWFWQRLPGRLSAKSALRGWRYLGR